MSKKRATLEPLPSHYNGLGLLRPTVSVPLASDDFMASFRVLWEEHVDFGTSRSHKKLLAQDKGASEWRDRLAAKKQAEAEPAEAAKKQKRKSAAGAAAEPPRRPPPAAAPPPARPAVLPNKGRWGSTLASQLIQ
mmetsp:Transcript_50175/g.166155  ORF Transcript_50175/g.166155 Transcript_50175/m.166155 type:complete len:135 (-) Transcript_50175:178-582(-)